MVTGMGMLEVGSVGVVLGVNMAEAPWPILSRRLDRGEVKVFRFMVVCLLLLLVDKLVLMASQSGL